MNAPLPIGAHHSTCRSSNRLPKILGRMRESPRFVWIGDGPVYAVGTLTLTVLGSGVMLMAPQLLEPAAFGSFALLTSLFIYVSRADFGLSQLADKQIPGRAQRQAETVGVDIVQALWLVGLALLVVGLPLAGVSAGVGLPPVESALAIIGGIMAMIANGPVTVSRASARFWDFTVIALVLQFGMTIPRLAGLVIGGVTGTFAALTFYYAACALLFARPSLRYIRAVPILAMARTALPLFVFNGMWILYLGANRWISAYLSSAHDLGLFSLSASLATIGLGLLSTIGQTRYPKLLVHHMRDAASCSVAIEREIVFVTTFLAAVAVVAVFAAAPTLAWLFSGYEAAAGSAVGLAVACIPLGAMTWMVPMLIVRSRRPVRDALCVSAAGLIILAGAMQAGDAIAGITGQAWGNAVASVILLAIMVKLMGSLQMTGRENAKHIVFVQVLACALVAALAWVYPVGAGPGTSDQEMVHPKEWPVLFEDDFETLDLQAGSSGTWQPYYPTGARSNVGNQELQYYADPRPGGDNAELQSLKPYRVRDGVLEITASPIPEELRAQSSGYSYISGLLNSADRVHFTYGSVEVRAKVPKGQGLWPAVWMLPQDRTWPPELDVLEVLGDDTSVLHLTAHSGVEIPRGQTSAQTGHQLRTVDLSDDFHVFGLTWTDKRLIWSLDGQTIFEAPTPADLHKPMFLLVNLAVGGRWPGSPDDTTPFPATFSIDWIRIRQPSEKDAMTALGGRP